MDAKHIKYIAIIIIAISIIVGIKNKSIIFIFGNLAVFLRSAKNAS